MDLEQNAFSPPDHDDTFLYIRYPKPNPNPNPSVTVVHENNAHKYGPITELLERNNLKAAAFENHTKPCQQFISGGKFQTTAPKIIKSNGVDDGFKGEGAACGTSVVRVAHQMVVSRGFAVNNSASADEPPAGWNPKVRRGSKSLPSSPLQQRKQLLPNRYFTGAFVDGSSSGILAGFLGRRDDVSRSVATLTEDRSDDDTSALDRKKSTSSHLYRPKPSELREMNFWSPTSM